MKHTKSTLDKLLADKVITGYNYFPMRLPEENVATLSISNVHETKAYLLDVITSLWDLGYPNNSVSIRSRFKSSITEWDKDYRIRDEMGDLYPRLRLRRRDKYLDLSIIPYPTLGAAGYSDKDISEIVGETDGYEIALPTSSSKEVRTVARLFLQRAKQGNQDSWKGAYRTPFIVITGGRRIRGFEQARLYRKQTRDSEISFVAYDLPSGLTNVILNKGFCIQGCLVNRNLLS